jgi:hypothetical protein
MTDDDNSAAIHQNATGFSRRRQDRELRRAFARRPAVESDVPDADYGRPVESRPSWPPSHRSPTVALDVATRRPQPLGKRYAFTHRSHSHDDDERCIRICMKGGPDPTPVSAHRGHFVNRAARSAPHTKVSAFVGIGVRFRRYPHPESPTRPAPDGGLRKKNDRNAPEHSPLPVLADLQ